VVSTFAGQTGVGGSADGTGSSALFGYPIALVVDSAGNIDVVDSSNCSRMPGLSALAAKRPIDRTFGPGYLPPKLRRITPAGVVTTLGPVTGDGDCPYGIAQDPAGNFYLAASDGLYKVTTTGTLTNTQMGLCLNGIAIDTSGNLYGSSSDAIFRFPPGAALTTAFGVTPFAGNQGLPGSADGTGTAASFNAPTALTTDGAGNVYVADQGNNTLRKITPAGVVTTLAGAPGVTGFADGTGAAAQFNFSAAGVINDAAGVAVDAAGNAYVVDAASGFGQAGSSTIRKIAPNGAMTTIPGVLGGCVIPTDGVASSAGSAITLCYPNGVIVDPAGNLYVANTGNANILKIAPNGGATVFAGTPAGATALSTTLCGPTSMVMDSTGNMFVADGTTVKVITAAGVVTNLAGTCNNVLPVTTQDGTGAAAIFGGLSGIVENASGNLYVSDSSAITIREVTRAGVVTTVAGTTGVRGSLDGTGTAAQFLAPGAMTLDAQGDIYIADGPWNNTNTIRKLTPAGVVTTVAGTVGTDRTAFGPLPALLGNIFGLAFLDANDLLITSYSAVLKLTLPH
jgi:sugar lactone lactonase YvrE